LRVLALFAHSVETSFATALHARLVEVLRARGHKVDNCDLHAEGCDPVMSR
jgi:NAD(P)H dehydrogenase (quinone)